ncbi:MAG: PKD domain-containing protein [Candidatus Poseidonia sp.]|nr:PKD domain-containing protein [Poseidonia sp.]MBL6748314.1 PKD domain-containing protein [Poseidonia sp.]
MSELRTSPAFLFITILLFASLGPVAMAQADNSGDDSGQSSTYSAGGEAIGDLDDFNPSDGSEYLFIHEDEPVVSATQFMRQAWIDAGRPGVEDMVVDSTSGRAAGRACTPHVVGDTLNVGTAAGQISAYVAKTTNSVAFIVQSGRTLSSTVLNNLASTWDSTIYPTMTTYYGKDYQDGRGLAPPDVDNNCQVQIVIYDIDGAYNTGGYFAPSYASSRESVFVDFADITLSWGKSILAHELEHLLHNALDPYENLWIDEGNADVAIYLCFGADSTLTGHVNAWTGAPEQSVRWWNQRIADYGAGYMFTMYLAEHLGGGPAVRQLVQDSATGGKGVENLALSPQAGQVGLLGRTMGEIFANFSIAATLDSDQGIYGYPNLDLNAVCTGGAFCRAQPTEINSDWATPWSSTGNSVEGWGIRSFQFTPGSASPAPLTLRLTADVSQFDGVIVTKATSDGLWSVTDLNFVNNVATGLVPGFGNLTDEVWVITWYASTIADCDYTSCGPSYPTGVVDIEAARITSPATMTLNNTVLGDRDGDGLDDTIEINYNILSNAFFEDLDVEISVRDSTGSVVDTITDRISAGGGVDVPGQVYFTAHNSDQYSFAMVMKDMLGDTVDSIQTSPQSLNNMKPVANGTVSLNESQTWENIQFLGNGFDAWGLSLDNNSLPYMDAPTAYAWTFGDNGSSNLKSPLRSYSEVGVFNATLRVMDQGGTWSETQVHAINVTDPTDPIPIITVNNVVIDQEITLLTDQRILFSAGRTVDNVPTEFLDFSWDWGDGTMDSGIGVYSQQHEWGDIDGENITYNLTLTVSDGYNTGQKIIQVHVNNRLPVQIYAELMTTMTYTSLVMPDVFEDDDGEIVNYAWTFDGGVRLGLGTPLRTDDYSNVASNNANPVLAWDSPGNKTVTLTVTDDDGSQVTAVLTITVLNQMPFAHFDVRTQSEAIDFREEDGEVDAPYIFDGLDSRDPDGLVGDHTDIEVWNWSFSDGTFGERPQITHSFTTPGEHTIILVVTDKEGVESFPRTMTVRISNPLPVIQLRILDGWINGSIITTSTAFPEGTVVDSWSHTFDENGAVVTAPGNLLYFDSAGTRDGDRQFEGKYVPFEQASPEWNGLVEYTWDFGDATPLEHGATPWHGYALPGTYTVTLTVRDAFGTGDVMRQSFTVVVDHPPEVTEAYMPEDIFVGSSNSFSANVSDYESGSEMEIYRDLDVDDGSIMERDERILTEYTVRWDFDTDVDADENGNSQDDWTEPIAGSLVRAIHTYEEAGYYTLLVEVCDGLGQCATLTEDVEVVPEPEGPPSLSDFSADEWKSWLADAGSELATFIGLIVVALVLGWLVMREPSRLEEEAKEAAETYTDIEHVESQGGLLGMDHHLPPPAPKILSKDERRSDESGYVRPLRHR